MSDREIKVDAIVFQKKVEKTTPKPRTVSSQGGGDDMAISTSYLIPARRDSKRHVAKELLSESTIQRNKEQLNFTDNISIQLVAPEEVTPTFRTPCMSFMVGLIEVPIRSVPA
jgi:hypothetical protein